MKNLSELVARKYPELDEKARKAVWACYMNDALGKGALWEDTLGCVMKHTTQLTKNAKGRDFADNTDAKFAMVVRMKSGTYQATINTVNKIGWLRICLCDPFTRVQDPRLYFMLVPHRAYSKLKGPLKVTFDRFGSPTGKHWDEWNCSFDKVSSAIAD